MSSTISTHPAAARAVGRRPLSRRWLKYAAVGRIGLLQHIAYAADLLARSLFLVVIVFVFVQLWRTIYAADGRVDIEGFSLAQMIWYFTAAECIILSQPRLTGQFDEKVKSGEIAYVLGRPYSFLGYHAVGYFTEGCIRLAINAVVGAAVASLLVGPIPIAMGQVAATGLAMLLSFALSFCLLGTIGLLAFWFEDTGSFYFIWQKLVFILGGMLVPLEVFPDAMQRVAMALPLPYMVYGPARLFVRFSPEAFWELIAAQAAWCVAAFALIVGVYRLGVKRIHANGG